MLVVSSRRNCSRAAAFASLNETADIVQELVLQREKCENQIGDFL